MTYVPSAYTRNIQGLHWILLNTPSGITTRLHQAYPSKTDAELAIGILGFKLVDMPRDELVQIPPR